MWKRRAGLFGAGTAILAMTAACADVPITQPEGVGPQGEVLFRGAAPDPSAFSGTLDAAFVRIAREEPSFGGLYYDANGILNVVMVPSAQARTSRDVAMALRDHLTALRIPAGDVSTMRVRAGDYSFVQLDAMHRAVAPVLGMTDVVFTDSDEVRNRIVVGVASSAAAAAVESAIAMSGVPAAAVEIVQSSPIVTEQTLRQHHRPVAGGLQINWPGSLCTHGFNVRAPNRPNVQGFVTNSHCSSSRGNMVRTPYWQPTGSPDTLHVNFIGREAHDIPGTTGGDCPAGRQCRWSDALGAEYADGVDNAFGAIYRTLFPGTGLNPGSLDVDPANPRWQITDEIQFPVVGQVLHKTGRTNGWTTGPVNATCQNVNVGGSTWTLWCQDRVSNWSGGGDSGSPYFARDGETNNVALIGIHWGSDGAGNTVMSAMANIRFENQGPVPWITFPGQTPPLPGGR